MNRNIEEAIQACIASYHKGVSPGIIIGCASADKQYRFSFGTHNEIDAISPDDAFDIASVTKAFVNVLTLKLIPFQELDQKISAILPTSGKYREHVTVRHLLQFGLEFGDNIPRLSAIADKQELVDLLLYADLHVPPGSSYRYTNITTMILTLFLEKKFGDRIDRLLEERLFKPLCIANTTFFPKKYRDAGILIVPSEQSLSPHLVQDESSRLYGEPNGSAGLFSTMKDILSFGQKVFLEKSFLPESVVKAMPLSQFGNQVATSFGLGLGLRHHNECNLFNEDGTPITVLKKNGFSGVHFCALPENDFCFSIFANICFWQRPNPESRDAFTKFHKNLLEIMYKNRHELLA